MIPKTHSLSPEEHRKLVASVRGKYPSLPSTQDIEELHREEAKLEDRNLSESKCTHGLSYGLCSLHQNRRDWLLSHIEAIGFGDCLLDVEKVENLSVEDLKAAIDAKHQREKNSPGGRKITAKEAMEIVDRIAKEAEERRQKCYNEAAIRSELKATSEAWEQLDCQDGLIPRVKN
jgi:hypothetical protein